MTTGAKLHLGSYSTGASSTGSGSLGASGIGSSISINGPINLLGYGDSNGNRIVQFSVASGASVDGLSSRLDPNSQATISNTGSTWSIAGALRLRGENVFNGATFTTRLGFLSIRDGATVTANTLEVLNYGRVEFQLTPNSLLSVHPGAGLDVDGLVDLDQMNQKIVITRSTFTLAPDSAFHVLSYGSLNLGSWSLNPASPNFLFSLPSLPAGFQWNVVHKNNSIFLVVPAPATLAVLAVAALPRRRRSSAR